MFDILYRHGQEQGSTEQQTIDSRFSWPGLASHPRPGLRRGFEAGNHEDGTIGRVALSNVVFDARTLQFAPMRRFRRFVSSGHMLSLHRECEPQFMQRSQLDGDKTSPIKHGEKDCQAKRRRTRGEPVPNIKALLRQRGAAGCQRHTPAEFGDDLQCKAVREFVAVDSGCCALMSNGLCDAFNSQDVASFEQQPHSQEGQIPDRG